jgi:hypothetical protein
MCWDTAIEMSWFEDGDHDLKPRKRISGFRHADHITSMGLAVSAWVEGLFGGDGIRTIGSHFAPGPSAVQRASEGGAERVIREFCLVV